MKNVLIVDDLESRSTLIKESLMSAGHRVIGETKFGREAIQLSTKLKPDVIILDSVLNDMFGIDVLLQLKKEGLGIKIIMTGAESQNELIEIMVNLGASEYVARPFKMDHLIDTINKMGGASLVA